MAIIININIPENNPPFNQVYQDYYDGYSSPPLPSSNPKKINKFIYLFLGLLFVGGAWYLVEPMKKMIQPERKISSTSSQSTQTLKFSGSWASPASKREKIAGYSVTSVFGPRSAPVPGASTFHRGTDLGTPIGTPVYAIGNPGETISVRCWTDSKRGGNVATFVGANQKIQYLHLSSCKPGNAKPGEEIAKTGNTGRGSGPHLHIERYENPNSSQKVAIERGFIHFALTGKAP